MTLQAKAFIVSRAKIRYLKGMKEEDFLKKLGVYSRYLAQFLNEGDIPKILDTIKELEILRQQAEREKIEPS